MVIAVLGFIEQVGSMIKEILKHNYYQSTPSNFKDNCQQMDEYELIFIG